MRTPLVVLSLLTLGVAACGGGDGSPTDPDATPPAIDAAMIDASLPPSRVVGTWRRIPTGDAPTPIDQRAVATMRADGTYQVVESGETETGTFTADATSLTVHPDTGEVSSETVGYAVTADRMVLLAMFPDGPVIGSVGTWRGRVDIDGNAGTLELVLRPDGTAHSEAVWPPEPPKVSDGTWAYDGDDVVFTYVVDASPETQRFQELHGVAIGMSMYERISQ